MSEEGIYCTACPNHCKLGDLAYTGIPKDSDNPIPGVTAEGVETHDIRPYCKANYIPPPED